MCVCVWCVLVCGVCVCVGVCVVKERLEVLVCEGWCVCVCVLRCSSRFPSASSRLPVLTTVAMSLTTGTGESSARTSMSSLQRQFWRQPTTSGCYSGEGTAHHPSVSLYHRSLCVCVCCAVSPDCPPLTVCVGGAVLRCPPPGGRPRLSTTHCVCVCGGCVSRLSTTHCVCVLCCVSRLSTTHCVCCAVSPDCPPLTVCAVLCLQTVHHSLCVLCCVSRLSTTHCVCCAVSPDCPPLTVCAVLCLQTVHHSLCVCVLCCVSRLSTTHCVCCAVSPDCPPLTVCVYAVLCLQTVHHSLCVCVCVCVLCLQTVHHSLCVCAVCVCCVSRLSTTHCVCAVLCCVSRLSTTHCVCAVLCLQTIHHSLCCAVLCLQTVHPAALLHPQGWAVAVLQGLHRPAAGHGPP